MSALPVPAPLGVSYTIRGTACLVAGNPPDGEPILFDTCARGGLIDPGRYRTHKEALEEAARLVAVGWRGVAVLHSGALVNAWPMCREPVRWHEELSARIGRPWATHMCGRHDLLDDGRCAEHSKGRPVVGSSQPTLFDEVAS